MTMETINYLCDLCKLMGGNDVIEESNLYYSDCGVYHELYLLVHDLDEIYNLGIGLIPPEDLMVNPEYDEFTNLNDIMHHILFEENHKFDDGNSESPTARCYNSLKDIISKSL